MSTASGEAAALAAAPALEVPARLPLRSDGTRLMRLSVSSLALFPRCPERWRRRYIEREREPQTGAMVLGSAVGAAITAHFAAQLHGAALSADEVDDLLLAEFSERVEGRAVDFGGETSDRLREQGREALRSYLETLAPGVRPRSVERKCEARFAGAEWTFEGRIDLEDERGPVVDFKVGRKHVSEARAGSSPQGSGYLLVRMLEGRPAGHFEFHSIRRGQMRSGKRCVVVQTERTEVQLRAFEARIAQTAREITRCAESGDWSLSSPEGWWCSAGMCAAWAKCPGGGAR